MTLFLFSFAVNVNVRRLIAFLTKTVVKRVKSSNDVPFGGFIKNGHPTTTSPQLLKLLHYKSIFRSKHA